MPRGSAVAAVVNAVDPNRGNAAGCTRVTIYGSGFTGTAAVLFGTIASPDFTVKDDSHISALSPGGSPGAGVDVTVVTAAGITTTGPTDRFNYCLLYTSPSPRDLSTSRMPSSA